MPPRLRRGNHRRPARGADTSPRSPRRPDVRRVPSGRAISERQLDDEMASTPRPVAAGRDRTAVQLDQTAHQIEADPEAALRTPSRIARLHEDIEDAR